MLVRMTDDTVYAALTDAVVRYGRLAAVDGVSLAIRRGETVGLVGESGCGKTSLAKALVGLVPLARGTLVLDGETVTAAQYRQRRWFPDRVQLLYQDAAASLSPRLTVAGQLREPLAITGRKGDADWTAALALLRALLMQPKLLVADEPTAGLDLSIQGELLNLLKRLQAGRDLTYMIVSHNLNVIGRVTDHILVMYLGQIVESGPTRQVYRQPLHPYTAALLAANPTLGTAGRKRIVLEGEIPSPLDPPKGCRFHTRCPFAQERCRVEVPLNRELAPGQSAACHFPLLSNGAAAA
jgi:oligopeptide transport system ATP-binding protein